MMANEILVISRVYVNLTPDTFNKYYGGETWFVSGDSVLDKAKFTVTEETGNVGTYNLSEYNIAGSKAYNKKVPAKVTPNWKNNKGKLLFIM